MTRLVDAANACRAACHAYSAACLAVQAAAHMPAESNQRQWDAAQDQMREAVKARDAASANLLRIAEQSGGDTP